ncbi:MAG: histidine phosphotransferase family protein [Aurantimonas endophytica]|uniref:Histidine phosphotransferase ChpT n=1 Tax=Aurantimonas endophytica TaxID=1522175 RepID=A0A7W6HFB7_9HYPH|nr:histidine phosphotransferase family protein [Aurantimonas endophytica]MBB4004042.1 histidine phosphotransferase ChpT [Aurantimonas endophytica]MCO6404889.1 histidine phosphotransferase [Aurantimonas endophytica]
MTTLPELSAADLAALLSSRLCHDIISPVFGIQSGLELLDDMPNDPESMDLVRKSLKAAVAKLQFARIAFGAAGSQTATIDLNEAKTVATGYMDHEKASLVWEGAPGYVGKNFVKVILNLVVLASASISRGGEVRVEIESLEPPRATVRASGDRVRMQPRLIALLEGQAATDAMDAQAIQPYYTLFLARESGLGVSHELGEGTVVFRVA